MSFHGTSNNIVQVKSTTKTSVYTSSIAQSGVNQISGLTVTIAPKFNTSHFLLIALISYDWNRSNSGGGFRFYRGGTELSGALGDAYSVMYRVTSACAANADSDQSMMNCHMMYTDTPATTSSTEYRIYTHACAGGGQRQIIINGAQYGNGTVSGQQDDGRAISTYVAMEIAQ